MKTIRSFLALKLDLSTVENLAETQKRLRESLQKAGMMVRWVPPPNIHLTMRFLGQITEPMAHALKDMLEPIIAQTPVFELETIGLGTFPDMSRPRVIWAGIGQGADIVTELHASIYNRLITAGFNLDDRPFNTHVTLGRIKSGPSSALETSLQEEENPEFGTSTINHFYCYQSDLSPAGAEYNALWVLPLSRRGRKPEWQPAPAPKPENETNNNKADDNNKGEISEKGDNNGNGESVI